MKRTPLRRQSKKRAAERTLYRSLASYYLKQHPYCEMPSETGAPSCMRRAVQIHHMKGCYGDMLCKIEYWLAVCQECHRYIEDHKKWSRKRGLILY